MTGALECGGAAEPALGPRLLSESALHCRELAWTRGAQVIIPHRDDVKIQSVVVSLNYLAVSERVDGLQARSHGCRMCSLGGIRCRAVF